MASPNEPSPAAREGIHSSAVYSLQDFQAITGLGDAALRQARRKGLPVATIGRRKYVRGGDFHAYLERQLRSDR